MAQTMNTQTNDQTTKEGGQEGTGPQKGRKKTPPHSNKQGQVTTRCPGTKGTGDQNGRNEKHETKGEKKKGEGRYVILRVVCSRQCCLSDRRVSVQLFPIAKETGLSLSSLRHGAAVRYISPERQPCQFLAFSFVTAYRKYLSCTCCLSVASGT